jgi:hypothetical protein
VLGVSCQQNGTCHSLRRGLAQLSLGFSRIYTDKGKFFFRPDGANEQLERSVSEKEWQRPTGIGQQRRLVIILLGIAHERSLIKGVWVIRLPPTGNRYPD